MLKKQLLDHKLYPINCHYNTTWLFVLIVKWEVHVFPHNIKYNNILIFIIFLLTSSLTFPISYRSPSDLPFFPPFISPSTPLLFALISTHLHIFHFHPSPYLSFLLSFHLPHSSYSPLIASFSVSFIFSKWIEIGLGPIPWLIVAEMFDAKYVATAMSMACIVNW